MEEQSYLSPSAFEMFISPEDSDQATEFPYSGPSILKKDMAISDILHYNDPGPLIHDTSGTCVVYSESGVDRETRSRGMKVTDNHLSYTDENGAIAVWVYGQPMSEKLCYFEALLLKTSTVSQAVIGLVPYAYPLNKHPGHEAYSIGYHGADGRLHQHSKVGTPFGPKFFPMDTIGCGIVFNDGSLPGHSATVFFTKNDREVGHAEVIIPLGGLHPAISLHSRSEYTILNMDKTFIDKDKMDLSIPTCVYDWSTLHGLKLNGTNLEYTGHGDGILDVGTAQAKCPLNTRHHYFEIKIIDPGESCFIAVGVARKNYPLHKQPGWNSGSVGYHADDGKLFSGSGYGERFGPRCNRGDVMGCGIHFYENRDINEHDFDTDDEHYSEIETFENTSHHVKITENPTKVQVFFTRNGEYIGKIQVREPAGGFYPTIGMSSNNECIHVDLDPLTG